MMISHLNSTPHPNTFYLFLAAFYSFFERSSASNTRVRDSIEPVKRGKWGAQITAAVQPKALCIIFCELE